MARIIRRTQPLTTRARRWILLAAGACSMGGGIGWALVEARRPAHEGQVAEALQLTAPAVRPSGREVATAIVQGAAVRDATGSKVALDRIEIAPAGMLVAVLRINDGAPARHLPGDSLGPGVRLARVDPDVVAIEYAGRLELLPLPAVAATGRPVRMPAQQVPRLSATLPRPPTPEVARLLDSAPTSGIVTASPDRANSLVRSGVDRLVAAEALRLSTP